MRRLVLLAIPLLVIAALALPARAQTFDMERGRMQMTLLNGLMRFHTGDDLRWSQAAFDDSAWPLISSQKDWSAQGYKDYGGFAWYRFKVLLPNQHAQLALYFPPIRTSYQVFADGTLVGSFGGFPPHGSIDTSLPQLVLLPQTKAGEMEIALRVWHWPHWAMYFGGGLSSAPRIGDAGLLREWTTLQDRNTSWHLTAQGYLALLNFLYAIAGFALFLMRRRERLYLYYALAGLFFGLWSLANIYAAFHSVPALASQVLMNGLSVAGFISFMIFVWMMLGARRTIWIPLCLVSAALDVVMWAVPALRDLPVAAGNFIFLVVNLPLTLAPVAMLVQGARRRNPDARLLLVPVGLNTLANIINDTLWAMLTTGHSWVAPLWTFWNQTFSWPFPFGLYELSIAILLIAILAIVVLRFARSRHEEDQLRSEREAARAVQQVLIPDAIPEIPNFRIESVYSPAGEVGGDFFQILPTPAGGVLLAIGDVSGKGMPAAMTVSLLVGTIRTLAHYTQSPAEILFAMNQRMLGRTQGGFTTCLVLRADPDGAVTTANAGHLAPYLGGTELCIDNGLPLGLSAEGTYPEARLTLPGNTQLTLLTDGVVEARNAQGELYGFDRTASISAQSAGQVAAAAQAHGQEDDITVLTLTRLTAGERPTMESIAPVLAPA
ncbi:MAG TPA: SpoIIE family protein phosphatase [Acidobacteriaceae bacterium]|nr:SpoIIE family protein phosphatase [Acidobacteriaceae bacterium]